MTCLSICVHQYSIELSVHAILASVMRYIYRILIPVLILSAIAYAILGKKPVWKNEANVSQAPSPSSSNLVTLEGIVYRIYIQKIKNTESLIFIPNFTEQKTTRAIVAENKCSFAINAGFYTPEQIPLGRVIVKDRELQYTPGSTTLLNGYFYKASPGKINIDSFLPAGSYEFAFQSGPLFEPGITLTMTEDEPARRILVGKTGGDFFFIAITESENINSGPRLKDVPQIISLASLQYEILLNLDGGSASVFFSDDGTQLEEIMPVGAIICGKHKLTD